MTIDRSYLEERKKFYMQGLQQAESEANRWRTQADAQKGAIAAIEQLLQQLEKSTTPIEGEIVLPDSSDYTT